MPVQPLPTMSDSLLEPEFAPHYEAWKADPNPANTGTLLKTLDPVVKSAMRTFSGQGAASPTIKSRAKLLVLNALPNYDPKRAKLRTHLMVNLQALRRATAEENQIVSVPERVRLDQHALHRATTELSDKLGRDPSDAELSEHTGLSTDRLTHVRRSRGTLAEGSTVSINDEGEETSAAPAVLSRNGSDTWLRFIYADLSPVDQVIMEHTLGLHGKPVLQKQQIARKLGVSPGAVSQRAARIQRLIDSRDELAPSLF